MRIAHQRVQQRHDALVAQLLADLRADVVHAPHLEGLGASGRLHVRHLLHQVDGPQRRRHLLRHAGRLHLVVEPATGRLTEEQHVLDARARGLHRRLHRRRVELRLAAELNEAVVEVLGQALHRAQPANGLLRRRFALHRQLRRAAQPEDEAVLAVRADALHRGLVQTALGRRLAQLLGRHVRVELQLDQRPAREVHPEVEPEDRDPDEDRQVHHRRNEHRDAALADEIEIRLALDDLHGAFLVRPRRSRRCGRGPTR